eukprot:2294462-Pleurochrysis_carterae.AAC.1
MITADASALYCRASLMQRAVGAATMSGLKDSFVFVIMCAVVVSRPRSTLDAGAIVRVCVRARASRASETWSRSLT